MLASEYMVSFSYLKNIMSASSIEELEFVYKEARMTGYANSEIKNQYKQRFNMLTGVKK